MHIYNYICDIRYHTELVLVLSTITIFRSSGIECKKTITTKTHNNDICPLKKERL